MLRLNVIKNIQVIAQHKHDEIKAFFSYFLGTIIAFSAIKTTFTL